MKKQLIVGHFLTLFIGTLMYVLFRIKSILVFDWINSINIIRPINYLREMTIYSKQYLPNWFIFSLPDGLWTFSYVTLVMLIWNNEIKRKNIFWLILLPAIAIISEIGQCLKLFPGTFDLNDILFYILGFITPLILFKNKQSQKKTNYV